MSQLGFPTITPHDPRGLGPYSEPEHIADLRHDFAEARLDSSAARLAREAAAQPMPDGRAVNEANRLADELQRRERPPGRFDQRDRMHDLPEAAEAIGQRMRLLTVARQRYTDPRRYQAIELRREACAAVADTLDFAGALAVKRWVPAIQNIVHRLPATQRREAGAAADRELRQFLMLLDRMRSLHVGMGVEAERWKVGVGTFDIVMSQLLGLFDRACLLAAQTTSARDRLSMHLRERAARAAVLLQAARDEWYGGALSAMHVAGANAPDEMAAFALVYRGVSGEVEAHFNEWLGWQKDAGDGPN